MFQLKLSQVQRLKKCLASTFVLMFAVFGAQALSAEELAWGANTKSYTLGDGDTLTIAEETTIDSSYSFSGAGTITLSTAKIDLNYLMTNLPFQNFTGIVRLTDGVNLSWRGNSFAESNLSIFGQAQKIIFNGATLTGFWGSNNQKFPCAIEVEGENTINNTSASSLSGVNLTFQGGITGSGTLTLNQRERAVRFEGDLSNFKGKIVIPNTSKGNYGGVYIQGNASTGGSALDFESTNVNRLYIFTDANTTTSFGRLCVLEPTPVIDMKSAGCTVKVGSKSGSVSEIRVPFVVNALTLQKVGADSSLILGNTVTFLSGSNLKVDEGTLVLDGLDLTQNLTTTFAAESTTQISAAGATIPVGTSFGRLELAEGAQLSLPAGAWSADEKVLLFSFTKKPESQSFTYENVKILGNATKYTISEEELESGATGVYLQMQVPNLTWNGGPDASWTDANVWLNGDTPATFDAGDSVTLTDGQVIRLTKPVRVANLISSGAVTLIGEDTARLEADGFTQNGQLTLQGTLTLGAVFDSNGSYVIPKGSHVTLARAQKLSQNNGVFTFSGAGELIFDGAQIGENERYELNYDLTPDAPFATFAGTVTFKNNVSIYYHRSFGDYTDNNQPAIFGRAKMNLQGFTIEGFYGANNVYIADGLVIEGENKVLNYHDSGGGSPVNFMIECPVTGAGTFTIDQPWHSGRGFKLLSSADLTAFTGTITVNNGGWASIETEKGTGPQVDWNLGLIDHLDLTGNDRTYQFGSVYYPRDNGSNTGKIMVKGQRTVVEIGTKANTESLIIPPFQGNALTLKKVGETSSLTLGRYVSFPSDSAIQATEGVLRVNTPSLETPISVSQGAFIGGTGSVAQVTFESGAGVEASATAEKILSITDDVQLVHPVIRLTGELDPKATYPLLIAGQGSTVSLATFQTDATWTKGHWAAKWVAQEDGTSLLEGSFRPTGFMVILR